MNTEMKKIITAEEVLEIVRAEKNHKGTYCGFRNATEHDQTVMASGMLDCSHVWIDAVDTHVCLPGTSVIGVTVKDTIETIRTKYNESKNHYIGDVVLLVADEVCEYGTTDSDCVLGHDGHGARVLGLVQL